MNFVHTFPHVAVCIGLAVDCEPVLGVVYCPALDQLYTGCKGAGAHCNGRPIRVRTSPSLRESLVCAEFGSDRSDEKRKCIFDNLQSVSWKCHGIRSLGSAAMNICSVASGQTNAYYEFGLHCWDICAPAAILLEAGGFLCDTTGKQPLDIMNRRLIVACSKDIAIELSDSLISQPNLERDDAKKR